MKFSSIPGLTTLKEKLIQSVQAHKVPHAQLFSGPEGVPNLPLAIAFANFLHCEDRDDNACGKCSACQKNFKYIHPDTHFIFPISNIKNEKDEDSFKANTLKRWREFLISNPYGNLNDWVTFYGGEDKNNIISKDASRDIIKTLSLKPFESQYKVMIIWQPETMHPSAANGILKILEEPPSHTYFLLVSNSPDQLMSTILSRTQRINVPYLSDQEIISFLIQNKGLEEGRAQKITTLSNGNLNVALSLSSQEENNYFQTFSQWMRLCFKNDTGSLVTLADEYHNLDKLHQKNILSYGLTMMRETLMDWSSSGLQRALGEELQFIQRFSKVMNLTKIEGCSQLFNQAQYHIERNGSAKMIFLDTSLKLAALLKS